MTRTYRSTLAWTRRQADQRLRAATAAGLNLLPAGALERMIPVVRFARGFEISARAVELVRDRLGGGGNLLVFSLGRDSSSWELVNRGGRTAFVEDLPEWIEFSRRQCPDREVYPIAYVTERDASMSFRRLEEVPTPALPESVTKTAWDVVVVDGPKGYASDQPGRASSIALASRLVAPNGIVLIDDYQRPLERHIGSLVFGRPADRVLDPGRPVGVYYARGVQPSAR